MLVPAIVCTFSLQAYAPDSRLQILLMLSPIRQFLRGFVVHRSKSDFHNLRQLLSIKMCCIKSPPWDPPLSSLENLYLSGYVNENLNTEETTYSQ